MIWGYPYFWKHPYNGDDKSSVEKDNPFLQNQLVLGHSLFCIAPVRCDVPSLAVPLQTDGPETIGPPIGPTLAFPANLEYNVHVWPCSSGALPNFFFELNESK